MYVVSDLYLILRTLYDMLVITIFFII